jgi:GT2 family glycosyltransferase
VNTARVWAVVLMYGNEEDTAECLTSLESQDHPALTILLVDNRSSDGAHVRLRARFPDIRYLDTGANLGFSGGMNRGVELALREGASDVLILNNDTTLDRSCVSRLVAARIEQPRVGAVAPKIVWRDDPSRLWYAGGDLSRFRAVATHRRFGEVDRGDAEEPVQQVTFASGCALLVPAGVLREVGAFAEDFFMYCEDVEFCLRLLDAGYGIFYVPAARVHHRDAPHGEPRPFEIRFRDRNRRRIVRRHYSAADRLRFMMWFYPTRLLLLLRYLARGDGARARALLSGLVER